MDFLLILFFSIFVAIATALKPIYLQQTIDAVTTLDATVWNYFLLYIFSIVAIVAFDMLKQLCQGRYGAKRKATLRKRLLQRIVQMNLGEFQAENGQNYITILNQETEQVVEHYDLRRLNLIYDILVLVSSLGALVYVNFILACIVVLFTVLPIVVSAAQGKRMERRTNHYTRSLEKMNVSISNLIQGFVTLKVNQAEKRYGLVTEEKNQDVARKEFAQARTRVLIHGTIAIAAYMGEGLLVGVSLFLILKGRLTFGALIAALQMSEMLAIPTNGIGYEINSIHSVKGIKRKLDAFLKKEAQPEGKPLCQPIQKIELSEVSFHYQGKTVLDGLSYIFEAGKKYLIIGENGSGKSTLFKLLAKLEPNYEGQILVNGTELREMGSSFYDQVGIILQNTFLMNDSLMHNITFYDPAASKETVLDTLHSLGLNDFLAKHELEEEYQDTMDNVSGGEKQRLAFARILLAQKTFILLDEATSAIDPASSRRMEERLLNMGNTGIINIEHKLIPELLPLYDEILELKNGKLIQSNGVK